MPYVNKPRPYKHEYQKQLERGEHEDRMERQRARRAMDKRGVNRKGKDVAHVKAGERHWHGAKADTTMGHITITLADGKATWG